MGRLNKIYLAAVFGALGGVVASYLHHQFLLDILSGTLSPLARLWWLAMLGVLVGGAIGFFPSLSDGVGTFSLIRVLRAGLIGAACGAAGGLVALPLAELLHTRLGGGVLSRMFALALFGGAIGVAEGINGGARWWRGVAGGVAGGAIAGFVLEILLAFAATYADAGIIALVLIGLFVNLMIALFVNVLSEAWLEVVADTRLGSQVYHLGKFVEPHGAVIGSDKKGAVFIWVPGASLRHAGLTLTRSGCRLRVLSSGSVVAVNGNPIEECVLRDGDVIEVAQAQFRYRENRRTALVGTASAGARPGVHMPSPAAR